MQALGLMLGLLHMLQRADDFSSHPPPPPPFTLLSLSLGLYKLYNIYHVLVPHIYGLHRSHTWAGYTGYPFRTQYYSLSYAELSAQH